MEQITGKDLVGLSPMSGVGVMMEVHKYRISHPPTVERAYARISRVVCEYFGLPQEQLTMKSRKDLIVKCRQIVLYLMSHHKEGYTSSQIIKPFGQNRDMVSWARKVVQERICTEPDYKAHIETLTKLLQ